MTDTDVHAAWTDDPDGWTDPDGVHWCARPAGGGYWILYRWRLAWWGRGHELWSPEALGCAHPSRAAAFKASREASYG
jgi:hypothetical protein